MTDLSDEDERAKDICQYCSGTGWGHPDNPAGRCSACHGSGFSRQPVTEAAARLLEDLARVNVVKKARIKEIHRQINVIFCAQLAREKEWIERYPGFPPASAFDSYREQRELKRREMNLLAYEISSVHVEGEFLMERPATDWECKEALRKAIEED